MFSDINKNYEMLVGAYKKLKSYYHYNKNFLFMREKIAEFEYNEEKMEEALQCLSKILAAPSQFKEKLEEWTEKINYYVLPKTFIGDDAVNPKFVTNVLQINKKINKVNLFIDMPIELHLLETVWTLLVGKLASDKKIIKECCYGNILNDHAIFNKENDLKKSINFEKNQMFKIYFDQYCRWKNNAIKIIDTYGGAKNLAMVSLDIKNFYYSVIWKFELIDRIIKDERYEDLSGLTDIMEDIYKKYTNAIGEVRELRQDIEKGEYVLPIGLFSSMLLANIYLSEFDGKVSSSQNIIYYGRYVDDMILVLDLLQEKLDCTDEGLDKLLMGRGILETAGKNSYCIFAHIELIIQKDKLKVLYFEARKSHSLINQLKNTMIIPSQMNVVPNDELNMADFEEAAYAIENFTTETKIRDMGRLEINRFKLGWHMAELVRSAKYKTNQLRIREKVIRSAESGKILSFFTGSNALEYSSNWVNALYFFMLTNDVNMNAWKYFYENVKSAINGLTISELENIKKTKAVQLASKMKKDMQELLNICVSTAFALNPNFYHGDSEDIRALAYMLRSANLFNHYLVAFPLINYIEALDRDIDLTSVRLEQIKDEDLDFIKGRKALFTPRFIHLDELFQFVFMKNICQGRNGGLLSENIVGNIRNAFLSVNKIYSQTAKPLQISIKNEKIFENYNIQKIILTGKPYDLKNIRIAVANIKLEIQDCYLGLKTGTQLRNRTDFVDFLREAYGDGKNKVDFILLPEFYLPMQWFSDVLSFVRKSGITVITGLQYITSTADIKLLTV